MQNQTIISKQIKIFYYLICLNSALTIGLFLNLDLSLNIISQHYVFLIIGISFMLTRLYASMLIFNKDNFLFKPDQSTEMDSFFRKMVYVIKLIFLDSVVVFNVFLYFINPDKIHLIISLLVFLFISWSFPGRVFKNSVIV